MASLKDHYYQLKSDLNKFKNALAAVPGIYRERVTLRQAEEQIKWLLETRVERFLELARLQIYERPDSPYLRLLKHARCDFSDLQAQVRRHGLERTLAALAKEGVYLTSAEFKGKTEVVRDGDCFTVSPKDFERRKSSGGFTIQSSGTRNAPINTFSSIDWRVLRSMINVINYTAQDIFSKAYAVYLPVLSGRVSGPLMRGKAGIPTERWFAPKIQVNSWLETKYHRWITSLTIIVANRFGPKIAQPEFLEVGDVRPIVEWILQKKREGKNCYIQTVLGNSVRICRAASSMEVSLEGTVFQGAGEPLTESKRAIIERAGARIVANYSFGGSINAGHACGNPLFTDEVHVQQSLLALVEHPKSLDDTNPGIHPLMGTTLHPMAPRLLLNVENGDYATMITRDCGCALEKVGFTQHLHTVRSFEKMTSEGMNYSGTDLFALLENIIPSEFGGGPGDYQLVEEEDDQGQTRLTLMVRPDVGAVDETKLLSRLQHLLAQGSPNNSFMATVWKESGTFRIKRETPYASDRGKVLPLRIRH